MRVLEQQRTFRDAHSGHGCELVRLVVGPGTFVHLSHDVGKMPIIPELQPSIWVKADRAHLQFMMRVVLPRAIDDATSKPISLLLRGDKYSDIGNWQQLRIADVATLLSRELVVLRTQFSKDIDGREAYADLIVLNAYSEPGAVSITLDDLEVQGYVGSDNLSVSRPVTTDDAGQPLGASRIDPRAGPALQGSFLTANGRPFMPRIIQHQGEPLEWLASLGFNTIKLSASPSAADLREAQRLDLWLVTPPPYLEQGEKLDPQFDRVLAWSLGARLTDRDLTSTRSLADEIRQFDPREQRPTVCGIDSDFDAYSRQTGILLFDQPLFGASFELSNYRVWLQGRSRLGRPGTPFWASVETQPSNKLTEQLILLSEGKPPPVDTDLDQLRIQAYAALAAGARGLLFPSYTPLGIQTPEATLRTDSLKLLNHELRAFEPWIAGGSLNDDLPTGDTQVNVSVWQTDRSRLLLITQHAPAQQIVLGPPPRTSVSVVVPGAPISDRAYQITPAGLKQLRGVHGSGGLRVTIEEPGLATAVVITQDPLVLHHLNKSLSDRPREFAQLRHDVTARRLNQTVEAQRTLLLHSDPIPAADDWLQEAQGNLQTARKLFASGDFSSVHAFAARAEQSLAKVRRGYWEQAAAVFPSPASSPCVSSFAALPLHADFTQRMSRVRWGANVLAAGDMENLEQLLAAGWRNQRRLPNGIQSDVSLSLQNPHGGRNALRIRAFPTSAAATPQVVERPPVWIASSSVPVRQGQIARIHGFVNVPAPLIGSQEGLLIFDSIGGPELGERIASSQGWREFSLYRAVPQTGELTLTFALTGLGEVWLDDIAVQLLDPEPIRPSP